MRRTQKTSKKRPASLKRQKKETSYTGLFPTDFFIFFQHAEQRNRPYACQNKFYSTFSDFKEW